MSHDEMATALRAAGWTVTRPVEAVPELAVGQVWQAADPSCLKRAVSFCKPDCNLMAYVIGKGTWGRLTDPASFAAWARRTNARPVTP